MADATEPTSKHGFLAELSRRHVWRAAVLYAGAAWALAQGIAQLGPLFNAPNWAMRGFVIACIIGFPFWVAFAWFYAWTPEGFKREEEVERTPSLSRATSRKLDLGIIGVLIVAVVLLASGYFVHRSAPAGTEAATFNPPADTLVVLPFANESGDPKQQYFSDGITEELTNALGQNAALTVIAWDTASHYRNSSEGPQAIGKALNVANLLHGSIQREGEQVRVVVELVNTRTGAQIWSNHYDDKLANVFQVQDKISASIAAALQVKFASLGGAPTVNPQAHDLVLQARALADKARTAAPFDQAMKLYEQAIALDPGYADAHSGLARAWFDLTQFSTLPLKDALPRVREEANHALALDPRNVDALVQLGNADSSDGHMDQAKAYYERALALDPSNADAHLDYGTVLPMQPGLAQFLEAVQLDPDDATAQNNLATAELDLGEYAQALAPMQALMRLDPTSADSAMNLALVYSLLQRGADAVKAFDLAQPKTELAKALVAAGRLTYQSLLDPKLHAQALSAVDALRRRTDLDPYSMTDVIQLELALGQNPAALQQLPKYCAATPVGCSDISVNPMYLPLRGDPRFQALVKQYDTVSKPSASASAAAASATTLP
ncbi:MAG: Adenylate cyclase [Rhodanobacteraceae bacterium]|jgi:TolB-like protein/Tfp pilus assembly protein PilF|nr:MAG: Adenylate cyclase [Rhodanobacteraceae bacterium]